MNIAIVSNLNSGIGLQREYELLREFLMAEGHAVMGVQYDEEPYSGGGPCDLTIFLEVIPRNMLGLSERRWIFPNPEWTTEQMIEIIDRSCEKIFAKTHEGERIFEKLFPGRVHYTGFLARDQYKPEIARLPKFLHIAGNSSLRGTEAVLDAWRWRSNGQTLQQQLIVIGTPKFDKAGLDETIVHFKDRVDEEELKDLQNECMFHLLPSGTEGFGHALHEALSVSAVVITTDAPPMNEIDTAILIPSEAGGRYNLASIYTVSSLDVRHAVQFASQDGLELEMRGTKGRLAFRWGNEFFKTEMKKHLGSSVKAIERVRRIDGKKTIAFLGNFEAHESTENMVKWALTERLDYSVETLQENKVNLAAIREAMEWNDLFLWVRTPGWLDVQNNEMLDFLQDLKRRNVPSLSLHLDKFWGIPAREERIGKDAFWRTTQVWTADGSRPKDFFDRGVKHHWMRPAISEEYCHPGRPYDHLKCDVLFVGAKDYHAEYPFRKKLVEWLAQTYGERFKHVTNVRGHELNNVYASAKVVVGDCIFSGTPYYWSDRVPETVGRYGCLVHPNIVGLDIPTWIYDPQGLESLQVAIEKLFSTSEKARIDFVCDGADWVRERHTWTVRMKEILKGLL